MTKYVHKVQYYETDTMGISHHSNYIRWMEEARMEFLESIGYGMKRLEAEGITSPVVSVNCTYKHTTTYSDQVEIAVRLRSYNGVKLVIGYEMTNAATAQTVASGESVHCFIDRTTYSPVIIRKVNPAFDAVLKSVVEQ